LPKRGRPRSIVSSGLESLLFWVNAGRLVGRISASKQVPAWSPRRFGPGPFALSRAWWGATPLPGTHLATAKNPGLEHGRARAAPGRSRARSCG